MQAMVARPINRLASFPTTHRNPRLSVVRKQLPLRIPDVILLNEHRTIMTGPRRQCCPSKMATMEAAKAGNH